ncbi:MAG: Maf family nucleotide pyrophosphatase [Bacteroidales bacterium]|nr:Maf family nucleotide pyrophosphatase [Bacteroidales bacterium]MCF8390513.1 Maf family nucleotide pyrophosphatase [Bacteroidales bacterium]
MLEKIKEYSIILATQSPRRHYLMKEAGFKFRITNLHSIEEDFPEGLNKFEIPVFLAELKSKAYSKPLKNNEILITADTIVWLEGKVIGKPIDRDDAMKILQKLSGNMHEVITGVCIRTSTKNICFHAHSEVWFSKISNEELNYYIDNFQPFDKAGAYGIQDWIGFIGIEQIKGSYFNVMGLPIQKLYHELEKFIS